MRDEDMNDWYTVPEFARHFPREIRSVRAAYKLAGMRRENGLEEAGACVKRPGRPLMFNRANFLRWQEGKAGQSKR